MYGSRSQATSYTKKHDLQRTGHLDDNYKKENTPPTTITDKINNNKKDLDF